MKPHFVIFKACCDCGQACAASTSHPHVAESSWKNVRGVCAESQWELVSAWDPALRFYTPVIFNHPPPAYYSVSPLKLSGSTFGSFSCSHAARFKQNQRMIALRPPHPPCWKKTVCGCGGGLAQTKGMTELAVLILQLKTCAAWCGNAGGAVSRSGRR